MADSVLDIRKALDTGAVSTGAVLVPEIMSETIRMFVETRSPLWNLIRRFSFDGYAYQYREQNGLPVASFGAELGALPAAQNATYAQRTVPIKSVYIRGEVSGQLIEASRSLEPVFEREINNSALGMVRTLEQKIVAGNDSVDPNEFDGLLQWITNTYDNTDGSGAGPLTLNALEAGNDTPAGGSPTHWIMGQPMRRKLWSLLQTQIRFVDNFSTIDGGFRVPTYNDTPIIVLFDNASALANTIIGVDMNLVYMPVLLDLTYEELAHTRDSVDYFLKTYLTLVVEGAARHHVKITNVDTAIV